MVALHRSSGVKFRNFPQLPVELRSNIWIFACTEPQLHVLRDEFVSRSRINTIFNTCVESREVVLGLELDYFMHAKNCVRKRNVQAIKNYFNPLLDTMWINRPCPNFTEDVDWTCGRCDGRKLTLKPRCIGRCISSDPDGPAELYRLAFNFSAWTKPGQNFEDMGPAELLVRHNISELLLVVGSIDTFEADRDVFFESPKNKPVLTTKTFSAEVISEDLEGFRSLTWEEMEVNVNVTRDIQRFKDARVAELAAIIKSDHPTDGELDTFVYWEEDSEFSKWIIPTIKFVVPGSRNLDWIPKASTQG